MYATVGVGEEVPCSQVGLRLVGGGLEVVEDRGGPLLAEGVGCVGVVGEVDELGAVVETDSAGCFCGGHFGVSETGSAC